MSEAASNPRLRYESEEPPSEIWPVSDTQGLWIRMVRLRPERVGRGSAHSNSPQCSGTPSAATEWAPKGSKETARLRQEVLKAAECFMRIQKDKDFHQTQYRQELSHKNMVAEHISSLKKRIEHCDLAVEKLGNKYEAALKKKMLLSLERTKSRPVKEGKRTRESLQQRNWEAITLLSIHSHTTCHTILLANTRC